ncbi:hypothetical protein HMPREF3097_00695 [Corynebacterium sp. HMSC27B11]|nr:hypothetical protein HMPREF3097_00695 [Corynebacterium sp. HMSC27B11]
MARAHRCAIMFFMANPQISADISPAPRPRRRLWKVLAGLLVAFLALMLTDSLIAARTEAKISQQLYEGSHLPKPPEVMLAGFPYVTQALTKELEAVTVTAKDVPIAGFGDVTVHSSAQYVDVNASQIFTGDIHDAPARKVFHRLQLGVVPLGKLMGIPDLDVSNKADISPRGGWETEAIFRGTPKGFRAPAIVEMKVRIKRGDVYLRPVTVIEGPVNKKEGAEIVPADQLDEATTAALMDGFRLKIEKDSIPFPGIPMRVYVGGGSVFIEAEDYYTTVSIGDLTPPTRPLTEEQRPSL